MRALAVATAVAGLAAGVLSLPLTAAAAEPAAGPADSNGDGTDDLAIGLCSANPEVEPPRPCEEHPPGGLVRVAYGSRSDGFGARLDDLTQATDGVPGAAEAGDRPGAAVQAPDIGADGHAGVLAGSPGENASSGGVWYVPGDTPSAITGAKALTPNNLGLPAPTSVLAYGAVLAG